MGSLDNAPPFDEIGRMMPEAPRPAAREDEAEWEEIVRLADILVATCREEWAVGIGDDLQRIGRRHLDRPE